MLKLVKFLILLIIFHCPVALLGGIFFGLSGAICFSLALMAIFIVMAYLAPHLLMGQIQGKMASSSTHLGDFFVLEAMAKRYEAPVPRLYIYDSNQINSYLVQGLFNSSLTLAISSECLKSLSIEERAILYKYHMIRPQFPLHIAIDNAISSLFLLSFWIVDFAFWPINVIRKRVFAIEGNDLQRVVKIILLPLLNFFKNAVVGEHKHAYIREMLKKHVDEQDFKAVYFKSKHSLIENLEYDLLSCNGFMGLESDIFNISTERQDFGNYMC